MGGPVSHTGREGVSVGTWERGVGSGGVETDRRNSRFWSIRKGADGRWAGDDGVRAASAERRGSGSADSLATGVGGWREVGGGGDDTGGGDSAGGPTVGDAVG